MYKLNVRKKTKCNKIIVFCFVPSKMPSAENLPPITSRVKGNHNLSKLAVEL